MENNELTNEPILDTNSLSDPSSETSLPEMSYMSQDPHPLALEEERHSLPDALLDKRRKMTLHLWMLGMSAETIKNNLNQLAHQEGWNEVSVRTVERDIQRCYEEPELGQLEEYAYASSKRNSHIARLEGLIERIGLHIMQKNQKGDWAPHEKTSSLEKQFKMEERLIRLQGWDMGRHMNMSIKPLEKPKVGSPEFWERATAQMKPPSPEIKAVFENFQKEFADHVKSGGYRQEMEEQDRLREERIANEPQNNRPSRNMSFY